MSQFSTQVRSIAVIAWCAVTLWGLVACTTEQTTQIPGAKPADREAAQQRPLTGAAALRRGTIATIVSAPHADRGEQIQAELVVDENAQGHRLEAGMFFRVLADEGKTFKGLVQVTEVLSTTRCLARLVGLTDRGRPLVVDDRVSEVVDLDALASPDAAEHAARSHQLRLDQIDVADRRLFDAVRANYQQMLTDMEARHTHDIAEREAQRQESLTAAEEAAKQAAERREAEHQAELASLRSGTNLLIEQALTAERAANTERMTTLIVERDHLRTQVDALLAQQQQNAARIETLVAEQAERQRVHVLQLRAEQETREILQARLSEIEARQAGRPVTPATVLSVDPNQHETVLDRLTRVTNELEQERSSREKLAEELKGLSAKAEALRAESASEAQRQAEESRQRMEAAVHERDSLEMARLEVERRYYDLSARILRLTATSPEMVSLQTRLRDSLSSLTNEAKP